MGCTSSKLDPEDKEANRVNASIDRQIKQDKKVLDRTIKILLLGMSVCRSMPPVHYSPRNRGRRVRQVHNHQTDAHNSFGWISSR